MDRLHRNRLVRWIWLLVAWVALALGALGVLLPGLPTTPFVLVAAYAAARGSKQLQDWLHGHRLFGPMIRDWERYGAVSRRAKRVAVLTMALCAVAMAATAPRWWMTAVGTGIMAVVGTWLWLRPEPSAQSGASNGPSQASGETAATSGEFQRSTRLPNSQASRQ